MARFYGTVQGGRGMASRLGHANTGLNVTAESWSGRIYVRMYNQFDEDCVLITAMNASGAPSRSQTLFNGPVAQLLDKGALLRFFQQAAQDVMEAT